MTTQMIKSTHFLLLFFTFCAYTGHGQSFDGGLKASLVVSQVAGDGYSGFHKAGVNVGAFVRYGFGSNISAQMDLAYIQKGSSQQPTVNDPDQTSYLLRLNYIELPLVLQYRLQPVVVELGVSFDFLAGQIEKINNLPNEQGEVWKKMNLGSVIGIQYILNKHWVASLRSLNSIQSIRKNSVPLNVRRYGSKFGAFNDAITIGLLYQF